MSLVKNKEAQHFKFGAHVQSLFGWHYFDIDYVKNTNEPLFLSKDGGAIQCVTLATTKMHPMVFVMLLLVTIG